VFPKLVTDVLSYVFIHKEFLLGAWIFTDAIDTGMSKLVGEAVAHDRLLHKHSNEVKCIGFTMWGTISEHERLNLKKATKVDWEQENDHK
jgi:hypothetical protein